MNAMQWMMVSLLCLASALAGGLAVRWNAVRRAAELRARIDKLEKARQVAGQHAAQARKQIELLQKEIATQQRALAEERRARRQQLGDALDSGFDKTVRIVQPAEVAAPMAPPPLPANGFADTLPMTSRSDGR